MGRPTQGKGSPSWEPLEGKSVGRLYPKEDRIILIISRARDTVSGDAAGKAWGQGSPCQPQATAPTIPQMASRAGWRNSHSSIQDRLGICLSPSACTSFQGQAGPWHPRSGRSQKRATCTYTCSSRVPNHHSPRMLTHCAPTQCTVHAPCVCTHVQRHLYTPLYMHTVYAHTRPFPEAHTTYLQPQGTTITDLGLPKATQGAECKPACSHTHGHLLKTGADPESHNS